MWMRVRPMWRLEESKMPDLLKMMLKVKRRKMAPILVLFLCEKTQLRKAEQIRRRAGQLLFLAALEKASQEQIDFGLTTVATSLLLQ